MFRPIAVLALSLTLLTPGPARAGSDSRGELVFTDALYGGAVGVLIAGGTWLIDQNDAGVKIGTGLVAGTVAGLIFGVADAHSLVRLEEGEVKFALPTPTVQPRNGELTFAVSLLHLPFE